MIVLSYKAHATISTISPTTDENSTSYFLIRELGQVSSAITMNGNAWLVNGTTECSGHDWGGVSVETDYQSGRYRRHGRIRSMWQQFLVGGGIFEFPSDSHNGPLYSSRRLSARISTGRDTKVLHCNVLTTSNGRTATYNSQASGRVQTLRQSYNWSWTGKVTPASIST